jgi:threonine dehydrogenase-like Zn-dependent dehydrogenase
MKAVTWHGKRDVRVDTVPDPKVEVATDAIIEVTSTNICGSDLHLYEVLGAFMNVGDILGHGGTISLIGAYGGMADALPMRMGQANVKKWVDDIMPLLTDDDPLGVDSFATHTLPLDEAPHAYDIFQKKQEGAVKIILKP